MTNTENDDCIGTGSFIARANEYANYFGKLPAWVRGHVARIVINPGPGGVGSGDDWISFKVLESVRN